MQMTHPRVHDELAVVAPRLVGDVHHGRREVPPAEVVTGVDAVREWGSPRGREGQDHYLDKARQIHKNHNQQRTAETRSRRAARPCRKAPARSLPAPAGPPRASRRTSGAGRPPVVCFYVGFGVCESGAAAAQPLSMHGFTYTYKYVYKTKQKIHAPGRGPSPRWGCTRGCRPARPPPASRPS